MVGRDAPDRARARAHHDRLGLDAGRTRPHATQERAARHARGGDEQVFPGHEVVSLSSKFTAPVVVPADGGAEVTVAGEAKPGEDGTTTVALTVTCGGQKVLGVPKAVVRRG